VSRTTRTLLAFSLLAAIAAGQEVGPVFVDGQAQVVAAFEDPESWVREELWVEAEFDCDADRKPDRLHVAVVRPGQTESEGLRVPVVYESSPYYSGTSGGDAYQWDVEHELGKQPPRRKNPPAPALRSRPEISGSQVEDWVPRGFAVVHSEAPGTGLSQGCPTVGGEVEALAPKAVIDWLNGRARGFTTASGKQEVTADWCTGKVGMTGTSYNGTIAVAAASTGVEGLVAIVPVAPNTSYYRYYRSNGLVRHPGGYLGEDIDVLYDFIHSRDSKRRAYCDKTVRDTEMARGMDRKTGDYNDFWAAHDLQTRLDQVQAATLMSHGFNDWNVMPEHSIRVYQALKDQSVPVQLYCHQGGHGGPPPLELMNRWFTRYLYEVENGVEERPRSWIVREGDPPSAPTPYPDYPHPDAAAIILYPTPGGEAAGGLWTQGPSAEAEETLTDNCSVDGAAMARGEGSAHRLLYQTPLLVEPVHLSGTPRLTVRVASNRSAANLSVWLVELPWSAAQRSPDGVITRGWADPQNHASLTESEKLKKGQFYDLSFELQPDDQIVPAGKRIGLMIFSSDRDFTLWPKPGTKLTVDLAGTSLELPVVGGAEGWARAAGG
jgi:X-Pro dipeptidyl-peptidase